MNSAWAVPPHGPSLRLALSPKNLPGSERRWAPTLRRNGALSLHNILNRHKTRPPLPRITAGGRPHALSLAAPAQRCRRFASPHCFGEQPRREKSRLLSGTGEKCTFLLIKNLPRLVSRFSSVFRPQNQKLPLDERRFAPSTIHPESSRNLFQRSHHLHRYQRS